LAIGANRKGKAKVLSCVEKNYFFRCWDEVLLCCCDCCDCCACCVDKTTNCLFVNYKQFAICNLQMFAFAFNAMQSFANCLLAVCKQFIVIVVGCCVAAICTTQQPTTITINYLETANNLKFAICKWLYCIALNANANICKLQIVCSLQTICCDCCCLLCYCNLHNTTITTTNNKLFETEKIVCKLQTICNLQYIAFALNANAMYLQIANCLQ